MIRAHAQAIKNRLQEDAILNGSTFQGLVLNPPKSGDPDDPTIRYCTFYINSGFREVERYTGRHDQATFSITVHSVASKSDQAQLVAERVFAQLLDYTPTVTGRVCRRLYHAASRPLALDTESNPPRYYCVDVFDLISTPA